eukprot:TRINITY_DN10244_c0_g1_i1.p1 TRINITY_DN10244_c0_g1~~TRINITY_DN10244_c0_g1_i1.p1  ORF type:complete len:185 (+),score=42.53 TRINITY_DN10244_c0_g1_i1:164-718(+)
MCIRDRYQRRVRGEHTSLMATDPEAGRFAPDQWGEALSSEVKHSSTVAHMSPDQVREALTRDFEQWQGGLHSSPGVWYACQPADIPSSVSLLSVYDLYFSKDPSKGTADLRSAWCMQEQIDTHFCPNDLTNFPGHEAMKNKNRSTKHFECPVCFSCLLYTSDAADEEDSVDLGGRRIIKKKKRE